MSAGWLAASSSTDNHVGSIAIDRSVYPTRYEEYSFVLDALNKVPVGTMLDAGSGFDPQIHILPQALAERGWQVSAVDSNYSSLDMPRGPRITRYVDDIRSLWRWQGSAFDAYVCVSTLEHMEPLPISWLSAVDAAFGCLKSGGIAILTADMLAPEKLNGLLRYAGFETGDVVDAPAAMLTPAVSWAIGRKP